MTEPERAEVAPKRATSEETAVRRQIKTALGDILARCASWRDAVAHMGARLDHGKLPADEAQKMQERCGEIAGQVMQARLELLVNLADAPRSVTSNSRVVDIERGLDNLEESLNAVKARLTSVP